MEISQKDRDSLRAAQQKLNPSFVIGNIVEHKIQDPVRYKLISRQEQGLSINDRPELPKVRYTSKLLNEHVDGSRTHNQPPLHQQLADDNIDVEMDPGKVDDANVLPVICEHSDMEQESSLPIRPGDVQANLWLNMNRVEFDKLEWMSDKAEKTYLEKLRSTTHFDRDGKAVDPNSATIPDRNNPVHDIQSLVKYLDSTYQPQITYSLNVISKIAARATIGLYDAIFDENIHQILLKECLLRVRRHIDSPNETICLSALKCLRSLICNTQVDEIFLDKMCPLKSEEFDATIWLSSDKFDFDIGQTDIECAQVDTILTLVARTDILTRFQYLLKTKYDPKFKQAYQDCILDILIRIARYSTGVCWLLSSEYGFPTLLIENFLPTGIVTKDKTTISLALRSIKFLRIVALAARELRHKQMRDATIKIPESIISPIRDYYHIKCLSSGMKDNDLIFRLHIETLRLMKSLSLLREFSNRIFDTLNLDQSFLVENLRALSLLNSLSIINSPSSMDWQYAASLIDLIGYMMDFEKFHSRSFTISSKWISFVKPLIMQWLNDVIREAIIPHQDVSIAIATTVHHFPRCNDDRDTHDLYSKLLRHSGKDKDPKRNSSLIYFKRLVREAAHRSQLDAINTSCGRLRDPVMLHSYGYMDFNASTTYDYKLNSVASIDTPFILLHLFISVLQKDKSRFEDILKDYIDNTDLVRYMRSVTCYYKHPSNYESFFQQSMMAQQEILILIEVVFMLSNYYLQPLREDISHGHREDPEPAEISKTRKECYSHLLFDAVSIIGLVNPNIEHMLTFKDNLLERVILNPDLHVRLSRDNYRKPSTEGHRDIEMNKFCRLDIHGKLELCPLKTLDFENLRPVYLSCEQPGRFWIFQPLIEYYNSNLKAGSKDRKAVDGKWFSKNISQGATGQALRTDCTDVEVICGILRLNATFLQHSSHYVEMAIRPNIEEHLCLIGSVFLDDDLFLNQDISNALRINLEILMARCLEDGKVFSDASRKIETLNLKLADFFNKLVEQYEASSYGDQNFSNFLLLFIAPKSDKYFRRTLFSDKVQTCLSIMRIGHDEVWVPPEVLVKDKESDPEIKDLIRLSGAYLIKSSFLDHYRKYHTS